MTYYDDLLATLKGQDSEKAAFLEEQVNIMIHKLKFLPKESWPNTAILSQKDDFAIITSQSIQEKVALAGGKTLSDITDNPHIIIILQHDERLYSTLPDFLSQYFVQQTLAYQNNAIFIINSPDFDTNNENYLLESEILAEILQSKYFYFDHEGEKWTKFDLAN